MKQVQNEKVENGDPLHEGKKKMGWKVYELMCRLFLEGEDNEYTFAHLFLTLEWNLMSRSENVADCHADNIFWVEDSLGFHFPKTKADQLGKRSDAIWHVYATPDSPHTCVHLSLARYLFSNSGVLSRCNSNATGGDANGTNENIEGLGMATNITINKGYKLFPGANQYDCFMKCFHKVINANPEAFKVHGIGPGDLGSHSARKGACSHASAGSTVSPPIVLICLRAMWSMGSVKERYLHYEKAGDQYLGQTVAGLNCNHHSFAVSPPYFDYSLLDEDGRMTMERKIHELVSNCIVGGDEVDPHVFCIFLFCFASVCYHSTFLKAQLHTPQDKPHACIPFLHANSC